MARRVCDPVTAYAQDVVGRRIVAGPWVRLAGARHLRDLEAWGTRPRAGGPYWFDIRAVDRVVSFFASELVLPDMVDDEGDVLPFALQPWQVFIVGSLFGWRRTDGHRRFRTAYIETGKGAGKALALDTPIPTLRGWTTMGEIQTGDILFDERGHPTTVLSAFDVMGGHECYRLTFDTGDSIVADADHLWVTEQRTASRRGEPLATKGVPKCEWGRWRHGARTTREIAASVRYSNGRYKSANHSIPVAAALDLPDAVLPIDPYVLGVWLGDGDSDCNRVTCGTDDITVMTAALRATGTDVGAPVPTGVAWRMRVGYGRNAPGLKPALRALGLLQNKHIPSAYLRASCSQRRALLQGLMDTDGWIASDRNACEFSGTRQRLVAQVRELVTSLGIKAFLSSKPARLRGRTVGTSWQVRFTPPDWPVFRLPRKLVRQQTRHNRRKLSADHRIVSCEPVPSVPVRCIAVDAPSRLFLAGPSMVPTHNTPLGAGIALYCLLADGQRYPEVYSAAVSQKQASITWVDAARMVEHSDRLQREVYASAHRLTGLRRGGHFEAISSEYRGLEGKRPHCAIIDEVHEHPNAQVVTKMRRGTKRNKDALIVELTNAGYDRTTICYQHHEYSMRVLEQVVANESWFSYVCGLDEDDAWTDRACWLKANPNIGVTIDWSYLQEAVDEAKGMPAAEADVRRLNFCEWIEKQSVFIPAAVWADGACVLPPPLGTAVPVGALDLGQTDDFSAFDLTWRLADDTYFSRTWYWVPEGAVKKHGARPWAAWRQAGRLTITPGDVVDYLRVRREVSALAREHRCRVIAYDTRFAAQLAQELQGEGFTLIDTPQGFKLNEATRKLEALLQARTYRHDGHPFDAWQASNLVVTRGTRGDIRPDKEKSGEKIDGMVAKIMALGRAMLEQPKKPPRAYALTT